MPNAMFISLALRLQAVLFFSIRRQTLKHLYRYLLDAIGAGTSPFLPSVSPSIRPISRPQNLLYVVSLSSSPYPAVPAADHRNICPVAPPAGICLFPCCCWMYIVICARCYPIQFCLVSCTHQSLCALCSWAVCRIAVIAINQMPCTACYLCSIINKKHHSICRCPPCGNNGSLYSRLVLHQDHSGLTLHLLRSPH